MYITSRFEFCYNKASQAYKEDGYLSGNVEAWLEILDIEAITPAMTAIAQGLRDYCEGELDADTFYL